MKKFILFLIVFCVLFISYKFGLVSSSQLEPTVILPFTPSPSPTLTPQKVIDNKVIVSLIFRLLPIAWQSVWNDKNEG